MPVATHNDFCLCNTPTCDSFSGELTILVAGSVCIGWSTEGLKFGCAHPGFSTFLCLMAEIRELLPDVFVHECTSDFPHELVERFLAEQYIVSLFPNLEPQLVGWPNRRPRQYIVCHRRLTCWTSGSPDGFLELFGCKLEATGDSLMIGSPEDVGAMLRRMAKSRKMSSDSDISLSEVKSLLPPGQFIRLEDYASARSKQGYAKDAPWFADISRNMNGGGPASGPSVPTLLTHRVVWSYTLGRPACAREHLACHGILAY